MAVGYPDYTKGTAPQRTGIGAGQTKWTLIFSSAITAGLDVTSDLYTVPAGKRLNLISGAATKAKSFLVPAELQDDGTIFMYFTVDIYFPFTTAESGGYIMEAGHVLAVRINNTNGPAFTANAFLWGTLEDV